MSAGKKEAAVIFKTERIEHNMGSEAVVTPLLKAEKVDQTSQSAGKVKIDSQNGLKVAELEPEQLGHTVVEVERVQKVVIKEPEKVE